MTKVLIVDDEPAVLRSTQVLLEELGYQVVATSSPSEVLELVRRHRPDAVLQDVRMPGLDLDALLRAIRADPHVGATPVVLFSAGMDLPEIHKDTGAAGYLAKPFKPDDVVKAIASVVPRDGPRSTNG